MKNCGCQSILEKTTKPVAGINTKERNPFSYRVPTVGTLLLSQSRFVLNKLKKTKKKIIPKSESQKKVTEEKNVKKSVKKGVKKNKLNSKKPKVTKTKKGKSKKGKTKKGKTKKGGGTCVPLDSWSRCSKSEKNSSPLNSVKKIYNGEKNIFATNPGTPVNPNLSLYTMF